MLTQEKMDKINSAIDSRPDEVEKILDLSPEEAVGAFEKLGVEVTADDLAELADAMNKAVVAGNGELNDEELTDVAGGCMILPFPRRFPIWPRRRPVVW